MTHHPQCPLCGGTNTEGPMHDDAFLCNTCGDLFMLDAAGHLVTRYATQHTLGGHTPFGDAVAARKLKR